MAKDRVNLGHNRGYIHKLRAKGVLGFGEDGCSAWTRRERRSMRRAIPARPPCRRSTTGSVSRRGGRRCNLLRQTVRTRQANPRRPRRTAPTCGPRRDSAVFEAFRILRDRLMAMPATCAPLVIGLHEVREVEMMMADEQRRALLGFEAQGLAAIQARIGSPR